MTANAKVHIRNVVRPVNYAFSTSVTSMGEPYKCNTTRKSRVEICLTLSYRYKWNCQVVQQSSLYSQANVAEI